MSDGADEDLELEILGASGARRGHAFVVGDECSKLGQRLVDLLSSLFPCN